MSDYTQMIPFVLHCEAGLHPRDLSLPLPEMFRKATLTGYSDDPDDPGGATMCGVTLAAYRAYRLAHGHVLTTPADLRCITFDEWSEIFHLRYWGQWRADQIHTPAIAHALVDWTWGSGCNGIIYPQRLLGVKADGIVGPITLAAVNDYPDQHALFDRIQQARNRYHHRIIQTNPALRKYINGWRRRVSKITFNGFKYE